MRHSHKILSDIRCVVLVLGCGVIAAGCAWAKDITILYTADTHAMIYPCSCPIHPEGGVARRAAVIKQIRQHDPKALLVDGGSFFAGGLLDEYTQNTDLDKERTLVNLKALGLMQYDAFAVGDDEFNFGKEFLKEQIKKEAFPLVSCNMALEGVSPFLLKQVNGVSCGIIGVTNLFARQKAGSVPIDAPKPALELVLAKAKASGAKLIIVLSRLTEQENLILLQEIPEITILVSSNTTNNPETFTRVGKGLLVRAAWQGKSVGKISLTLKDDQVDEYKVEEIKLSSQVGDDPQIKNILPRCFRDSECHQNGMRGSCQNPGIISSQCVFSKVNKVGVRIISERVYYL